MATQTGSYVPQNVGLIDRVLRVALGGALLGIPSFMIVQGEMVTWWHSLMMLVSVYPFLTGILGFDYFYKIFSVKSCDTSKRNLCGSFPFQVDAFLGHKPIPKDDVTHTLSNSYHEKHA